MNFSLIEKTLRRKSLQALLGASLCATTAFAGFKSPADSSLFTPGQSIRVEWAWKTRAWAQIEIRVDQDSAWRTLRQTRDSGVTVKADTSWTRRLGSTPVHLRVREADTLGRTLADAGLPGRVETGLFYVFRSSSTGKPETAPLSLLSPDSAATLSTGTLYTFKWQGQQGKVHVLIAGKSTGSLIRLTPVATANSELAFRPPHAMAAGNYEIRVTEEGEKGRQASRPFALKNASKIVELVLSNGQGSRLDSAPFWVYPAKDSAAPLQKGAAEIAARALDSGTTDAQGKARLALLPGSYRVACQHEKAQKTAVPLQVTESTPAVLNLAFAASAPASLKDGKGRREAGRVKTGFRAQAISGRKDVGKGRLADGRLHAFPSSSPDRR